MNASCKFNQMSHQTKDLPRRSESNKILQPEDPTEHDKKHRLHYVNVIFEFGDIKQKLMK